MQIKLTTIPFVNKANPNSFYCNSCKGYRQNFYKSAIDTGYRRCRDCHQKTIQKRKKRINEHDQLLRKLKVSLSNLNRKDLAKLVRIEHVKSILETNGLKTEDQIKQVKAIKPSIVLNNIELETNEVSFSITLKKRPV